MTAATPDAASDDETNAGAPELSPEEVYAEVGGYVVEGYATYAFDTYSKCVEQAKKLRRTCRSLASLPSDTSLRRARQRFSEARLIYGKTEVFRFYGGPIDNEQDGPERLINAWPLDEAYIEPVADSSSKGILADETNFPNLSRSNLVLANERGGPANISVGWHAIEFLLWGPDPGTNGTGGRTAVAFTAAKDPLGKRRGEYLVEVSELLVEHLEQVRDAWAPGRDNYRRVFVESDVDESLSKILVGLTLLTTAELGAEKLRVPFETRSDKTESSRFSDLTHLDLIANQSGIRDIWRGRGRQRVGFREVAFRIDAELAYEVDAQVETVKTDLAAIPAPFDRAIQGDDQSDGRRAVSRALRAVEKQGEYFSKTATAMGFAIPPRAAH